MTHPNQYTEAQLAQLSQEARDRIAKAQAKRVRKAQAKAREAKS